MRVAAEYRRYENHPALRAPLYGGEFPVIARSKATKQSRSIALIVVLLSGLLRLRSQ